MSSISNDWNVLVDRLRSCLRSHKLKQASLVTVLVVCAAAHGGPGNCPNPKGGDCLTATLGVPGCSDGVCCTRVCEVDDYCCDVEWDGVCASWAGEVCVCPEDLDDDGFVGIVDLAALLAAWGPNPGHPADLDLDDFVGIADLLELLANWGPCPPRPQPEPDDDPPGTGDPPSTEPTGTCGLGGGCGGCSRCPDGAADAAIDVRGYNGQYSQQGVDLSYPGDCLDALFGRSYESPNGPANPSPSTAQGNGWDFSYNISILEDGPDIVLCDGNSRQDTYAAQGPDTWRRREDFRELTRNKDGTYTMAFADTGEWAFNALDHPDAPGKVSRIQDRNGNQIQMAYDAGGRLTTVTDTLDREYSYTYNPDGLIETVTDELGREVRYEYYQDGDAGGSAGDLKSVRTPIVEPAPEFPIPAGHEFPEGKTTVYTYTTGFADEQLNHALLTTTDPKGQLYLQNVYAHTIDENDPRHTEDPGDIYYTRLVRQIWGESDEIIDFVYEAVEPRLHNNFAVTRTIVNDRVGNVKEYFYDAFNRMVIEREHTGRWPDDEPTFDTNGPPIPKLRDDDPDFFETRYFHNQDSLVTRIVHPNGNEERFTYDEANPGRRSQGNLIRHCELPGPLGGDQDIRCEAFEYDDEHGGCCGTNFVTLHRDFRGNETLHEYDDLGNRVHTQHRIPQIVEDYRYNQDGQMVRHIHPDNGSGHRRVDVYTYYDSGPQSGWLHQQIIDHPHDDPGDPPDPPEVTDHFELTTTYEYNAAGIVNRVIDPRGSDTQYVINQLDQTVRELAREVELPNDGGQLFRYETDTFYDANDNVVRVDIQNLDESGGVPNGNTHFTTIYDYEILDYRIRGCAEAGDVGLALDVRDCAGIPAPDLDEFIVTEYEYDANRNRTLTRSGEATNGNQPANTRSSVYDERDLVYRQIQAEGDQELQSSDQYDYDGNRNVVRVTTGLEAAADPEDPVQVPRVTIDAYDGYDRLVMSTDPMGNVTEYHYDPNGNTGGARVPGELNPFGVRVLGELDDQEGSAGNLRLSQMTYQYDEMDRVTSAVAAFFDTQTQNPLPGGQLIGKAITRTEYTDESQLRLVRNDNLHETVTAYDTASRVLVVTDAKDNSVTYEYDANSNVTAMIELEKSDLADPDEEFTTTYTYDGLDRLIATTDNAGNTNRHQYDSRDNQTVTRDALDHETRYVYDGINRLIRTVRDLDDDGADGDGPDITTTQAWDDTSRLIEQTDDNGNTTRYVYDALDRLQVTIHADTTSRQVLEFDAHDNPLVITDANGSVVGPVIYDLNDRETLNTVVPGPGVSNDTTFEIYTYDGLSRLVSAEDDDSVVTNSYDSLSQATQEVLNGQTTQCTYDGVGNMTRCVYPSGRTITCTYDELERKKTVSDASGHIASYDYVGPGRVARREYTNGTRTDYTYDGITGIPNPPGDFGVKQIIGTHHRRIADDAVLDERTFTWDRMYNKTQRADVRAGGPRLTHNYAYDPIYRLVRTVVTDPVPIVLRDEQYDLDGVGNRNLVTGGPDPGPYTMDPTLPEPADLQMNQYTTTPQDQREYDRNGNLIGHLDPGDPPPMATVTYDYRNQMVEYIDPSTGVTAHYTYDALGRRIESVVNAQTTRYFYDGRRVCEEQDGLGMPEATYVYGLYIDEVLNMQRGGTDYYYHCDDLYNVMAVTDDLGQVVERYEYQDYGNPEIFDPIGAPRPESAIGNPYLFTGRRFDPETGWYYYRTRYLDPIAARFTTRDTIGIWGSMGNLGNGYTYVGNNPATLLDPLGQKVEPVGKQKGLLKEALDDVSSIFIGKEVLDLIKKYCPKGYKIALAYGLPTEEELKKRGHKRGLTKRQQVGLQGLTGIPIDPNIIDGKANWKLRPGMKIWIKKTVPSSKKPKAIAFTKDMRAETLFHELLHALIACMCPKPRSERSQEDEHVLIDPFVTNVFAQVQINRSMLQESRKKAAAGDKTGKWLVEYSEKELGKFRKRWSGILAKELEKFVEAPGRWENPFEKDE
ncbi:MAG: RHS repeat domain-containing protein [Planctomycetota bacterium]|jgi:RHS repeat-associated protein